MAGNVLLEAIVGTSGGSRKPSCAGLPDRRGSDMDGTLTDSLDDYLAAVEVHLRAEPVLSTVLLTVAESLRQGGTSVFGDDAPAAALRRSPSGWRSKRHHPYKARLRRAPQPKAGPAESRSLRQFRGRNRESCRSPAPGLTGSVHGAGLVQAQARGGRPCNCTRISPRR
jgi:hypothetical protein